MSNAFRIMGVGNECENWQHGSILSHWKLNNQVVQVEHLSPNIKWKGNKNRPYNHKVWLTNITPLADLTSCIKR